MGEMKFTPAQQNAIDAYGGSVLVSAAAGSGKTRVLVQRVIKLLTDEEHPVDADRLLIVTFTKAAAEEMRSRISSALEELLFRDPTNARLRRQQLLLANADICTIHSFCSRMIRENFYLLDINQDFRIASEGEAEVLKNRIMAEIIEEQYSDGKDDFLLLSELLSGAKTDKGLEKALLSVYERCNAHPFPETWLREISEFYQPEIPLSQTIFARTAMDRLAASIAYMRYMLEEAGEIIEANPSFCTSAQSSGEKKWLGLKSFLERLSECADSEDWDRISDCIQNFPSLPFRKPTGKKNTATEEECTTVKNSFDNIESAIHDTLLPVFGTDTASFQRDNELLYPAVCTLCDILRQFDHRYFEAKKNKGVLDFSDLEHQMLRLLAKGDSEPVEKTEIAGMLSEQYDEIMVDEYQDTNDTQECIFRLLSREESNLFVVGDIKQSIYRFREARPEIFKRRRQKALAYNPDAPTFPARIILDKNFRSCKGIIDSVNFVFRTLMSERVGEITYNEDEKLTLGANYPQTDEIAHELHLLSSFPSGSYAEDGEENEDGLYEREARYIAGIIKKMIRQKTLIKDGSVQRPVSYGDFSILMRFVSSHGQTYADILNQCGIPAYIDKPYSLFGCYEVNLLISLLKTIDNPLQDIPVLSLLLCPVFGFTVDDLTELKTNYHGKFLYNRIQDCLHTPESAQGTLQEKCAAFDIRFRELRRLSVTISVSKLLQNFFDRTAFLPIMQASENGTIRIRNIRKFMDFLMDYEGSGNTGLTEFVRYLLYLEENGTDMNATDTVPADSVRIMSVHHSKGLEFPVCIMAGLNAKGSNTTEEILCHTDLGFGLKTIDRENLLKFNTLQRNIIRMSQKSEELSEAMRVLYVAMTRAKEKIISVVSYNTKSADGLQKKLKKIASMIQLSDGAVSPYSVENASSLADWLIMCALVHPSMQSLRQEAGREDLPVLPCAAAWKFILAAPQEEESKADDIQEQMAEADPLLVQYFQQQFSARYQFEQRTVIPSKVSASALVHQELLDHHIARSRPSFIQKDQMTGAEKGTAMHRFLQFADLKALLQDPDAEKRRLLDQGVLTKQQVDSLSGDNLHRFVRSQTFQYISQADTVLREYRFTVNIKASDIDPSYSSYDEVILQGAMDCLLIHQNEIIIIDYKTDRVKDVSELSEKYARQLSLYKNAAEQLFELPVKKCLIYSLDRSAEIEVCS